MLKKSIWLACLLLYLPSHAFAQTATRKASDLKKLGREAIIEIAEEAIKQRNEDFSRENFDRIKVLVKTSSVYVSFSIPVRYVPLNSSAYYGVLYGLADPKGPMSSWDTVSNPPEAFDSKKITFFQPTEASDRVISFVLGALDIDAGTLSDQDTVTITEQENAFDVSIESPDAGSSYTVAKVTGEVQSHGHSHNFPMPGVEGEERFEELVD